MPVSVLCPDCERAFQLKDEMAGRKVRCPQCERVLEVPQADEAWERPPVDSTIHSAFDRDRFLLRQKLMAVSAKYVISDEEERPILFVVRPVYLLHSLLGALGAVAVFLVTFALALGVGLTLSEKVQPAWLGGALLMIGIVLSFVLTIATAVILAPKRHVFFYPDETQTELVLQVQQDKKFQPIVATYTVLTPEGAELGRMKKNYLYNFFRKQWRVLDPSGRILLIAREDSLILSLLRRFLGPLFGFLRTNFIFCVSKPGSQDEEIRGEFNRKFTLFDRYVLDMSRDRSRLIDRRIAVALGVLLDTGEGR